MNEEEENLDEMYKDVEEKISAPEENPEEVEEILKSQEPAEKEVEEPKDLEEPEDIQEEPEVKEEPKIKVKADETFDENPASVDSIMREVLADTESVEITATDKNKYLKAVLNDVPVELDVSLCGGQLKTKIRSRTSWEQTCLYAALQKDQDEGVVKDLASVIIQLQKYGCAIMLLSVNNKAFSNEKIDKDMSISDAIDKLRKLRVEKIEPLSMPKWGLLLNALRLFEGKLAKMGTACLNEDFWEPVD